MGYQTLMADYGLTQEETAKRVGKSRPAVANALRLLALCPDVLELVRSGQLSAGHARAVLTLKTEKQQKDVAQKIVALGQIAVGLAQATGNAIALQQIVQILGGQSAGAPGMAPTSGNAVNPEDMEIGREPTHMVNARARARGSTMPTEGGGTV
jgi:ParB family chromosome partitioning protein